MRSVIERMSKPGDIILDPFCGAGTTGVVALAMSRKFIGIDVAEEHVRTARMRLAVDAAAKRSA